jgi:hypothetical protein
VFLKGKAGGEAVAKRFKAQTIRLDLERLKPGTLPSEPGPTAGDQNMVRCETQNGPLLARIAQVWICDQILGMSRLMSAQ